MFGSAIGRVLRSGHDLLGDALLRTPAGPTYETADKLLPPLNYAVGRDGNRLTASGVYYLPFTLPVSVGGPRGFGLHVADGSEIIIRRTGGPHLIVRVGRNGRERYGACAASLATPHLADGYLPILETSYRDRERVSYRQESFVARLPGTHSLASVLRIEADARKAERGVTIRITGPQGEVARPVQRGHVGELSVAFIHSDASLTRLSPRSYGSLRARVSAYWRAALAHRTPFVVPEPAVVNAERALLVQELEMTWRYSVGNPYEELSFVEALDTAQAMAEYGYRDVSRQILRFTLRQLPKRFTSWRAGARLLVGARYFELTGDRSYLSEEAPALAAAADTLHSELAASPNGLLPRERYSSDIGARVYGLHGQTTAWQGLLAMARAWTATGQRQLARKARADALRLGAALRRAVSSSERVLSDGSLFIPMTLLDDQRPFTRLTMSRAGSYWNLVAPFALTSGFFAPASAEARGALRYLTRHGARVLGLVRAGAYRLLGYESRCLSGTDQVYGFRASLFLADNDQSDQLVLSLYGALTAAMTPGTFVSGEAATLTPVGGFYRAMYLPPNSTAAASWLETLRLMLIHESRGPEGQPRGLQLAFSTPRAWLTPGKQIVVNRAPTAFGPISYRLRRHRNTIRAEIIPPRSPALTKLQLRIRLPNHQRLFDLTLNGRSIRADRASATIDLGRPVHPLTLTARIR